MLKWLKAKKLPGFTLLELVVVIVVIGILAAVAIPTFSGVITRANDAKAQTTLNAVARDAQALYRFDNGSTPLDWYNAFNEAVAETPAASDYYLASETTLTLTLDLPHGTAQELIDAAALAVSLEGANPALAGPSASPNQLSVFADPSGDVGMAIASSGNCVFGTIINDTISTWSAKRDLGADCAGSIAFVDPVTVAALEVRDVSEYSNLTVPVAGTLGTPTIASSSISFAVNFTATASAPIDSFEVSRNGTILDATVLAPLTSYTDNTAVNGTSYTYSVRAQNSIGYSTSVSTTAATSYALPEAPGFPILEASDAQISIGWLAPSITTGAPISGYRLYRSADSGPYLFVATITPETTLTYIDTALTNGTSYSYQLESYGTGGTSPRSPPSSSVTPITTPSASPELTVSASNLTNTLTWTAAVTTAAAPVTGYLVQTSPNGTGSWTTIYTGSDLTYTHTPLTNGTDYFYRVAATNSQGTGTYSSTVASTPIEVAAAPTNLTATPGNAEVNLSWTPVVSTLAAPVTGYYISKSTSVNGPFILDQTVVGATSASATSTGLNNGTTYFYQISSYGAAGTGIYSAIFPEVGVTPSTVPSAPAIGTASGGASGVVSVSFTPGSNGGSPVTIYTVTSSSGRSNTGAASPIVVTETTGGAYTYTVRASSANGESTASATSNSVTTTFPEVMGGTLTSDATYYYRTFTSSGTLTVTGGSLNVDYLIVGGGGGASGGTANLWFGPGGAGGVVRTGTTAVSSQNYSIVVGAGGAAAVPTNGGTGGTGGASSFSGVTASGGNGGGPGPAGASNADYSGAATGNGSFADAGGGAGAGGNASTRNGGPGVVSSISGTSIGYGGGGAGGANGNGSATDGGGRGLMQGQDGRGGGASGANSNESYRGGSGVVIIRYLKADVVPVAVVYPTVSGGTLSSDSTYYYRSFTSSGTFSVSGSPISVDLLVVAGGGAGGNPGGSGGGGAGGVLSLLSQTIAIGNTGVTVGAGGTAGGSGADSYLAGLPHASGGGAGGVYTGGNGTNGGSGGGASSGSPAGNPGTGIAGQGYAGGTSIVGMPNGAGGGGGAGGVGGNGSGANGGAGGSGTNAYSSWLSATGFGVAGYIAGGGGGGGNAPTQAPGGSGGGGAGSATSSTGGVAGMANTGSGGGSNSPSSPGGGAGGSGLVIIRYLKTAVGG